MWSQKVKLENKEYGSMADFYDLNRKNAKISRLKRAAYKLDEEVKHIRKKTEDFQTMTNEVKRRLISGELSNKAIRKWYKTFIILRFELHLLITGEVRLQLQVSHYSDYLHDRGDEIRKLYKNALGFTLCSVEGLQYERKILRSLQKAQPGEFIEIPSLRDLNAEDSDRGAELSKLNEEMLDLVYSLRMNNLETSVRFLPPPKRNMDWHISYDLGHGKGLQTLHDTKQIFESRDEEFNMILPPITSSKKIQQPLHQIQNSHTYEISCNDIKRQFGANPAKLEASHEGLMYESMFSNPKLAYATTDLIDSSTGALADSPVDSSSTVVSNLPDTTTTTKAKPDVEYSFPIRVVYNSPLNGSRSHLDVFLSIDTLHSPLPLHSDPLDNTGYETTAPYKKIAEIKLMLIRKLWTVAQKSVSTSASHPGSRPATPLLCPTKIVYNDIELADSEIVYAESSSKQKPSLIAICFEGVVAHNALELLHSQFSRCSTQPAPILIQQYMNFVSSLGHTIGTNSGDSKVAAPLAPLSLSLEAVDLEGLEMMDKDLPVYAYSNEDIGTQILLLHSAAECFTSQRVALDISGARIDIKTLATIICGRTGRGLTGVKLLVARGIGLTRRLLNVLTSEFERASNNVRPPAAEPTSEPMDCDQDQNIMNAKSMAGDDAEISDCMCRLEELDLSCNPSLIYDEGGLLKDSTTAQDIYLDWKNFLQALFNICSDLNILNVSDCIGSSFEATCLVDGILDVVKNSNMNNSLVDASKGRRIYLYDLGFINKDAEEKLRNELQLFQSSIVVIT